MEEGAPAPLRSTLHTGAPLSVLGNLKICKIYVNFTFKGWVSVPIPLRISST